MKRFYFLDYLFTLILSILILIIFSLGYTGVGLCMGGFIGKILFNLNMQGITYLFDIFNINITEYGMIMLFSFIGGIAGFLRVNFCLPFETIYQLNSILKTLEEDDDFNED